MGIKSIRTRKNENRFNIITAFSHRNITLTFSIFFVAFVVTFLSFSIFTPISSSDAATVNTTLNAAGYYIDITSHDVDLSLDTSVLGTTSFAKDTITTKTNSPSGYKLYVSMENDKDCNKTTGVCDGTGTGENIVPGNALYQDGDSASGNFISPTTGTFSAPDALAVNSWGVSTAAITTGNESTFWKMPLLSSPQLIQSTSSANTTGVTKDLYFGAKANFSLPSGSYSNTIVYTAAGNAGTSSGFVVSPTQSSTVKGGGDTLTITTTLYTNYALSPSDVTVTIGGNTCTVSSVYTNTSTSTVEIKCTTPSSSSIGLKNVVVNIDKFSWSSTLTNGFNYGDFWTITYMQEMTSQICNTVYTPSNVTGSSALLKTSRTDYTATTSGTAQVAQRTLYDYRGIDGTGTKSSPATGSNQVSYTVRKLADGNCWMTDNLKLTLSTSHSYEVSTNSGGTTSWTPNQNMSTSENNGRGAYNAAITINTKANTNGGNWYYPWYAAIAGSITQTNTTVDAPRSICPKGWRLPTNYAYSTTKSYGKLTNSYIGYAENTDNVYDYSKLESIPLSFLRRGRTDSGNVIESASYGNYHSSTSDTIDQTQYPDYLSSRSLLYTRTYVYPQNTTYSNQGMNIRCVSI